MFTNLKVMFKFFLVLLVLSILNSCSFLSGDDESEDIETQFLITPKNYSGKKITGLVKFEEMVETPIWYSASGMLKFDGVSTADSVDSDSVLIYYTDVPYITKVNIDTLGVETYTQALREKDTVYIRYYNKHTEYISTQEIILKNFKPEIDSFHVQNGNYLEFGHRRVASFLIGSGTGKIKCFSDNFMDDSVSIYWHSNSDSIAERRLMNYLPFEFEIPTQESNVMLYVDVINKNGAVRKDSIDITIYKERGSIWVLDESSKLLKFSSLGGAIAKIDSIDATDIEFLENSNSLIAQSYAEIARYYTTGKMMDFALKLTSGTISKMYKFDNDLYVSTSSKSQSILNKYSDEGDLLSEKIKFDGELTNFIKHEEFYVFSEQKDDSCFLHTFRTDSIINTQKGFLRIKQLDKYSLKGYIIILDDIYNKVTVYDLNRDSIVSTIKGFNGKPVAMSVNDISGVLYILDGASSLKAVNLQIISGDVDMSLISPTPIDLDLPKYLDINEYSDTDGAGSIWICDTHNDRVVKLNSSGIPLVEINGFFYLPQKLVINKGL